MARKVKPKNISIFSIQTQVATLMASAFALVAALFWNDAIKAMINAYMPAAESWPYMMLSAVIVTVIAVIAIVLITKYVGRRRV